MKNSNEKSLLNYLEKEREQTLASILSRSRNLEMYKEIGDDVFPTNIEHILKYETEQKEILMFHLKWLESQITQIKSLM
jgi:chaperonin cofactor prefoldin